VPERVLVARIDDGRQLPVPGADGALVDRADRLRVGEVLVRPASRRLISIDPFGRTEGPLGEVGPRLGVRREAQPFAVRRSRERSAARASGES